MISSTICRMLTIRFRGIGLEHGKNQGPEEGRDLSYHAVGIDRADLLHDLEHVGSRECHTFSGLRSPCTMPASGAAAMPAESSRLIESRSSSGDTGIRVMRRAVPILF